jgi:hypothetical protein
MSRVASIPEDFFILRMSIDSVQLPHCALKNRRRLFARALWCARNATCRSVRSPRGWRSFKIPYLYYEVIEGGHASGATPEERSAMTAREYTCFARQLGL